MPKNRLFDVFSKKQKNILLEKINEELNFPINELATKIDFLSLIELKKVLNGEDLSLVSIQDLNTIHETVIKLNIKQEIQNNFAQARKQNINPDNSQVQLFNESSEQDQLKKEVVTSIKEAINFSIKHLMTNIPFLNETTKNQIFYFNNYQNVTLNELNRIKTIADNLMLEYQAKLDLVKEINQLFPLSPYELAKRINYPSPETLALILDKKQTRLTNISELLNIKNQVMTLNQQSITQTELDWEKDLDEDEWNDETLTKSNVYSSDNETSINILSHEEQQAWTKRQTDIQKLEILIEIKKHLVVNLTTLQAKSVNTINGKIISDLLLNNYTKAAFISNLELLLKIVLKIEAETPINERTYIY